MKIRLNMIAIKFALILLVWYAWPLMLSAQEEEEAKQEEPYIRIITTPEVKVCVIPPENGTAEEKEFFKTNFEMELMGAAYDPVPTVEESDFYMTLAITRWEGEDPANELLLTLFTTLTGREIVTLSWGYNDVTDMYAWNLYMIYQAMANAPIVKILPDATLTGVAEGFWGFFGGGSQADADKEKEPHQPAFYAGLRAGPFLSLHSFQTSRNYFGGTSRSVSGEAAVLLEFHPFRYFSVEMEGIIVYESFGDNREISEVDATHQSIATFSTLSLQIPLYLKVPVTFDRISFAPFVGAYWTIPLGQINMSYRGNSSSFSYSIDPPLGLSLGVDGSFSLGPGKVVVGLRYERDMGTTIGVGSDSPIYSRERVGLTAGYAFKLWQKKKTNKEETVPPEEETASP
jgi:hypothetical protein